MLNPSTRFIESMVIGEVEGFQVLGRLTNDYFTIEKSYDGINYIFCDKVFGSGTTSMITEYSYDDRRIHGPLIYYRLSQVDYDGNSTTFDPIAIRVSLDGTTDFAIVNLLGQEVNEYYEGYKLFVPKGSR